jgi:hypothetical protein
MMKINKEELEVIVENLASKESRETFFVKYFMSADPDQIHDRVHSIPEKYVDEMLEIKLPEKDEGNKDYVDKIAWTLASAAELSRRYEKAAHLYKKLNHIPGAVAQLRLAGLNELADKWAEEYINGAFKNPSEQCFAGKDIVEEAVKRAREVKMVEKAKDIARAYVGNLDNFLRKKIDDPYLLEETADFAAKHELAEETDSFYRAAMQQFEKKGEYDCALRVARKLDDTEKIGFYDNLRYITADKARRKQIDAERAEELDAQK